MKYPVLTFAVSLIVSLAAQPGWAQAPTLEKMDIVQRSMPDGPVALVNGKPISREDFLFLYTSQLARMHFASGGKKLNDTVRISAGISTLAELVQRELLCQLCDHRKLKVSQADVQKAYDEQLELLKKEFTANGEKPTEEEILQRSGQSRDGAFEDIHKSLLVAKASAHLAKEKGLQVSDEEAREFFDNNKSRFQRPGMLHLKQIFIRADGTEGSWEKAEKAIKKAQARFTVGESFAGVAKSMSDGQDAEEGGDMKMRPTQAIPPIYVEKANTMKIGETSQPFKSEQGWHIIRLVAKKGASDISFEDAREFIKARLMQAKTAAAVEEYCQPIIANEDRVQIFLQLRPPVEATASRK